MNSEDERPHARADAGGDSYSGGPGINSQDYPNMPEFLSRSNSRPAVTASRAVSGNSVLTETSLNTSDAAIIDDVLSRTISIEERKSFFQKMPEAETFPNIAVAALRLMGAIRCDSEKVLLALKKHQVSSSRIRAFKRSNPANIALQIVTDARTQPERDRCGEHAYSLLHAEMERVAASDLISFLARHTKDESKKVVRNARRNNNPKPKHNNEDIQRTDAMANLIQIDAATMPWIADPGRHIVRIEVLTTMSAEGYPKFTIHALADESRSSE